MNFLSRAVVMGAMGCAACAVIVGCGVTSKKLDDAERRISLLSKQGVSDSLLTDARVLLVQIKTAKQYGGGASPQRLYDSVITLLARAELTYTTSASKLKPVVDSLRKSFEARKQGLSGMQRKEADSLIHRVDSLIALNKWSDVKPVCSDVDTALNGLAKDEKKAVETKTKLIGTWTGVQKVKNKEEKADFVEKKVFSFTREGKVTIVEERNGQTNEGLKEDWKFQSGGAFTLKGDTILLMVSKEKCLKQSFTNLVNKNGKPQWVKTDKPSYDSTITSGKKDRFITFDYLKESFKKK
ncbi:MAG TPA: hypothetical protein VF335_00675 [Chitinivibrionales bacterium]